LYQVGFDALWEVDLFGGQKRATESANATLHAAEFKRADVALTLTAEVVRTYMEVRGAQRRIAVAEENLVVERDSAALAKAQFDAGLASNLAVFRANAELADTQSTIPALKQIERANIYRLGVLIGRAPEDLRVALDSAAPIPVKVVDVPAGLPSELLERRPDIRFAEQSVAAANARIGVATAELYPHFYLTGIAGLESLESSNFLTASSRYFSVGPNLSWTIFDAGRVRFQIQAAQAMTEESRAVYEKTVLTALAEVETAFSAYAREQQRHIELEKEVAFESQSVDLSRRLYRQGINDFLAVLDAQRSLLSSEDRLAQSDEASAVALIAVYKALGGGWNAANTQAGAIYSESESRMGP
jgi:NodT family efflux transporter outer membrane factor (OMF) lipoprotein